MLRFQRRWIFGAVEWTEQSSARQYMLAHEVVALDGPAVLVKDKLAGLCVGVFCVDVNAPALLRSLWFSGHSDLVSVSTISICRSSTFETVS